eukprot:TRINITY_DN3756_c0_g2_i2.p2 TRINITY_DN3756_c0_g2~~TRINITY_DN3756_c0_g2_i2.p2  ORF type:complete len:469 (-),score=75.79 TRINITY_DN3756_c0_g2_i2:218-1624(-)
MDSLGSIQLFFHSLDSHPFTSVHILSQVYFTKLTLSQRVTEVDAVTVRNFTGKRKTGKLDIVSHGYRIYLSNPLGEGQFGKVYLGENVNTGERVAIKTMKKQLDAAQGIHFTAIREIKFLTELKHENIVNLYTIFMHEDETLYLVLEFLPTEFKTIIEAQHVKFTESIIKSYMFMLLSGINYLHSNWCIHRDLKPDNILVAPSGHLKIVDFGDTRNCGHDLSYTPGRVTLWYRSPELLFGAKYYSKAVDMWSIGCIFAEMMIRMPYLPGENEIDQLGTIFAALGTPTLEQWPNMNLLPAYMEFERRPSTPFTQQQLFSEQPETALRLLSELLTFDPLRRISAPKALEHPFFTTGPEKTPIDQLPTVHKEKRGGTSARKIAVPVNTTSDSTLEDFPAMKQEFETKKESIQVKAEPMDVDDHKFDSNLVSVKKEPGNPSMESGADSKPSVLFQGKTIRITGPRSTQPDTM